MQALAPERLTCILIQPLICPTTAEDLHPGFLFGLTGHDLDVAGLLMSALADQGQAVRTLMAGREHYRREIDKAASPGAGPPKCTLIQPPICPTTADDLHLYVSYYVSKSGLHTVILYNAQASEVQVQLPILSILNLNQQQKLSEPEIVYSESDAEWSVIEQGWHGVVPSCQAVILQSRLIED